MGASLEGEQLLSLAVAVTSEQRVESVLANTVRGLAAQPGVALARIWLLPSADVLSAPDGKSHSSGEGRYLRLAASCGKPTNSPGEDWSYLRGHFARVSFSVGKVGQIAAEGRPILIPAITPQDEWIRRPDWVRREAIRSFAGHPLIFRGQLLGVIAVFSRIPLVAQDFAWLGLFANHAAVAIANARAFEEVTRLRRRLEMENDYLQQQVEQGFEFGEILGGSRALRDVLRDIRAAAPTNCTVLLSGESGTGKELAARAIHELSPRRERPLITVNCASIPRELFESEFFGHVKGAFTGALRDRVGRFQLADRGTIFLDEVGEIPLDLQSKLLRVLQEGTFERVGEDRVRRVDVRVIAATNRVLIDEVDAGRFRQDLYFRLCVFPLTMPPLRERVEDIGLLAEHFADLAAKRLGAKRPCLTPADVELLANYSWPGNVRELQNVIERAVILAQGGPLFVDVALGTRGKPLVKSSARNSVLSREEIARRERENILRALEAAAGRIYGPGGAAALLGIKPTTLASRLKRMKIDAQHRT